MRQTRAHSALTAVLFQAVLLTIAVRPAAAAGCTGDCNQNGMVTVDEVILMVDAALGLSEVSTCVAGDVDGNDTISITEIVIGVNNALTECGAAPTPTRTPGGSASYVGDYYGTAGFYGVRFHVAADGAATGFLDFLSAAIVNTGGALEVDASYDASGQANLATGSYSLAGDIFGSPFDFSGQLPATADGTGTLHVNAVGAPADGSLYAGTPPPSPTATPLPGCDSADLQMTFSNTSATFNGNAASFAVTLMITAIEQKAPDYIPGLHEVFNSTFNGTDCSQPRSVQILIFEVPGGLAAGQSFPISQGGSPDGGPGAIVYYGQEASGGDGVWSASAGTLFIDAVDGSVVTLRVVGAAMTVTAGAATGSFTLDVSGQVNNFTRQP